MALSPVSNAQTRVSLPEDNSHFPILEATIYGVMDSLFGCARKSIDSPHEVLTAGAWMWVFFGRRASTVLGLAGAGLFIACKTGHYVYQARLQWAEYWSIESLQQLQQELYKRFNFGLHGTQIPYQKWNDACNQLLVLRILYRSQAILLKERNTVHTSPLSHSRFVSALDILNQTYRFARGLQICNRVSSQAFFTGSGREKKMRDVYNTTHDQFADVIRTVSPHNNIKDMELIPGDFHREDNANPFKIRTPQMNILFDNDMKS
jgi:hypothetical protein